MKEYISKGIICVDSLGIQYRVCEITYIERMDGSFSYVFKPNYSIISLLDNQVFNGIQGLNLALKKEEYQRNDIHPVFISERVPMKNREDYIDLFERVGLDCFEPIQYLIRTDEQYFGDNLYVVDFEENRPFIFGDLKTTMNNTAAMKTLIGALAKGDDVIIAKQRIGDDNRKVVHDVLISLYKRSIEGKKALTQLRIEEAKRRGVYRGRKALEFDIEQFKRFVDSVNAKELTAKRAAELMNMSIDKYYRERKKLGLGH